MKRVLSFLMAFALLFTSFSNVTLADETPANQVKVNLKMGESVTYTQDGSIVVGEPSFSDPGQDIVSVDVIQGSVITDQYSVAKLGTDKTFSGEEIELDECLFTFTLVENTTNGYTISHTEGESVIYLSHNRSTEQIQGYPCSNTEGTITVSFETTNGGNFTFNHHNSNKDSYLYFRKGSSDNLHFDRQGGKDTNELYRTHFDLFIASTDASVESDIKGYEKLTSSEQIVSGQSYLIAAKAENGNYYILNPSTSTSSKYAHVAQVVTYNFPNVPAVQLASGQGNFTEDTTKQKIVNDCLFTFKKSGTTDNTYVISAKTEDGTMVYLNHRVGDKNIPTKTESKEYTVQVKRDNSKLFNFAADNAQNLYFYRNGNGYFDNYGGEHDANYYELYKPLRNASDTNIAEYKQVTSLDEIKDGGKYLIVANIEGEANYAGRYIIYPSTSTEKYMHVAKLTDTMVPPVKYIDTKITFTGVEEGDTDVTINDITYKVHVENDIHDGTITLRKGESRVIPGILQREVADEFRSNVEVKKNYAPYTKVEELTEGYYLIGSSARMIINTENKNKSPNGLTTQVPNYVQGDYAGYLWNIKVDPNADGKYTIQDVNDKYIYFEKSNGNDCVVKLSDTKQSLSITKRTDNGYEIANGSHKLNRHGGDDNYNAAGWNGNGTGNAWNFYTPSLGVELTSVVEGTTTLTISGVEYTIEFVSADVSALSSVISNAESTYEDADDYMADEWTAYQNALDMARTCVSNVATVTQAEVNTAKTNLEAAIRNLEATLNKAKVVNVSLGSTIGLNFCMKLGEDIINDNYIYDNEGAVTQKGARMQFTIVRGEEEEILEVPVPDEQQEKEGDMYYVFTCPLPIKDMNTNVKAQIILSDGRVGIERSYSVSKYFEDLKQLEEYRSNKNLQTLVAETIEYGDLAAKYFDVESTVEPMTDDAKAALRANLETALEEIESNIPTKDTYFGSSLLLKSDTILRHYFTKEVRVAEEGYKVETKGNNYWYVESEGIPAHLLGEPKTVTVTTVVDGEETPEMIKITYSPLNYAYIALNSGDEKLIKLMGAMYDYQQAALNYNPGN